MKINMKRVFCLLLAVLTVALLGTVMVFAADELVSNTDGGDAVALVGDTGYTSLNEAVAAAETGDTVKLVADVTLTEADFSILGTNRVALLIEGKAITLDLNGKQLTVDTAGVAEGNVGIAVASDAELIFKDSGNGAYTVAGENAYYAFRNDGKLTVESGNVTFTGYEGGAIFFSTNNDLLVKDGNFTQTTKGWMANTLGNSVYTITFLGGTYNRYFVGGAAYGENTRGEVVLGEGLSLNDNGDGTWSVRKPVIQVGDRLFGTMIEALSAAEDGDTVILLDDVKERAIDVNITNESTYEYSVLYALEGKSITLDFNGHTLTVTPKTSSMLISVFFVGKGASLTVKDSMGGGGLRVNAGSNLYSAFYNSASTLVIENGDFYVEKVVVAGSVFYADKENNTVIENGFFTLGNATTDASTKPWIFNVHGKNEGNFILVNGGTFNQDPHMNLDTQKDCEVVLPEGRNFVDNGNGTWSVNFDPVAQVGDRIYGSLADAIKAAKDGETVILLDDIYVDVIDKSIVKENTYGYSVLYALEGKSVTLDFNGHTLTVTPKTSSMLITVFFLGQDASLTVKDSVGNGGLHVNAGSDLYCAFYNSASTLVIENGDFYVEKVVVAGSVFYADKENNTVIENGFFTLGNATTDASTKPWIFNVHGKNEGNFILVNGGTFNQDPHMNLDTQKDCEVVLPEGRYFVSNGDGTWSVNMDPVAQIGDRVYGSLADAIAAAKDGDTVMLIADVTLTEADLSLFGTSKVAVLVEGKSITLDLNGKKLTVDTAGVAEGNVGIGVAADAELILKDSGNGAFIVTGENAYYAFRNDGKLTVESGNVTFTGYKGGAIFFSTNDNLLVKGGNFTQTTKGWMANTSGNGTHTITFLGGTYNRYFVGGAAYGENTYGEAVLGEGLSLNDNGDGTWTVGVVATVEETPLPEEQDEPMDAVDQTEEPMDTDVTVVTESEPVINSDTEADLSSDNVQLAPPKEDLFTIPASNKHHPDDPTPEE